MGRNSDYFTFYANNSDNEDLSAKIKALQSETAKLEQTGAEREKMMQSVREELAREVREVENGLRECREGQAKVEESVGRLRENVLREEERI
jgi:predicted RNase H-like nuclease (RuvC/YqgF family)